VIDCGDRVVAVTRQRGRGSASGAGVELEYAQLIAFADGRIVRTEVYLDRERALEAAGLRELYLMLAIIGHQGRSGAR
jgi:ketosteroid isomerase-like protein